MMAESDFERGFVAGWKAAMEHKPKVGSIPVGPALLPWAPYVPYWQSSNLPWWQTQCNNLAANGTDLADQGINLADYGKAS